MIPNTFREQVFKSHGNAESATCVMPKPEDTGAPVKAQEHDRGFPLLRSKKNGKMRVLQKTAFRKDTVNRGGTADILPSVSTRSRGLFSSSITISSYERNTL